MNNKTIAGHRQQNNKPRGFENSWSITYRKPNYDALGDPHASYYFLNKSVHKHLYALRKVIHFIVIVNSKIRSIYRKEENQIYDKLENQRL